MDYGFNSEVSTYLQSFEILELDILEDIQMIQDFSIQDRIEDDK